MTENNKTYTVLCQKWEESERGWGTRPDGYSLHLTDEARRKYIEDYWKRMPDYTPDEYSRPSGTAYWAEVSAEVFNKVKASANGVMFGDNNYPGHGGKDGWCKAK